MMTAFFIPLIAGYSIDIKGGTLLFILLLLASLIWSIVTYRRTIPPSGIALKILLAGLRFCALALLLFLIFEPSISHHSQKELKPILPVIIDNSRSMDLKDASGERARTLAKLLADPTWIDLKEKFDVRFFATGDSLRRLSDSPVAELDYGNIGTNLSSSFRQLPEVLENEPFSNLIFITDGGQNEGHDPVRSAMEFDKNIFMVGIGDTGHVCDARIASIIAPGMTYRGRKAEITVRIAAAGMANQSAQIDLIGNDDEILASKKVKLPDDELLVEEVMEFTPNGVGHLPLKVRLHGTTDEWDQENNLRSQPIEVLESKLRILAIAGKPSEESQFFLQTASSISDFEVTPYTLNQKGEIYGSQQVPFDSLLSQIDVVVIIGLPRSGSRAPALIQLKRSLNNRPLPIWIWTGSNPNLPELRNLLGSEVPIQSLSTNIKLEADVYPDRYYLVLDPDSEAEELPFWWNLPPIQVSGYQLRANGEIESLINFKNPETGQVQGIAVLGWEMSQRRYALSVGSGYWRWSFMKQGMGETNEFYQGYIYKMIRWLGSNPQVNPLQLSVDKKLYSTGEPVALTAQLRRGDGEEVLSGQVEVIISSGESTSKMMLVPDQKGNYLGSFQPEQLGSYSVIGTGFIGDEPSGTDSTGFFVETYNIEKETLRQNVELLRSISSASGGKYMPASSFSDIENAIEDTSRIVTVGWNRRFFLNWDLWSAIILLLCIEWAIRKRRGML